MLFDELFSLQQCPLYGAYVGITYVRVCVGENIYVFYCAPRRAFMNFGTFLNFLRAAQNPKEKLVEQVENHFYEMKGDVGMSLHEKERNKKMPTPRHKVTHNPIPTSLFLSRLQRTFSRRQLDVKMFRCLLCLMHS